MSFSKRPTEPPFIAEGGVHGAALSPEDPFLVLDELMAVPEALSPSWPQRAPFTSAGDMRL